MLGYLGERTVHHHATADGDRLAILDKANAERYRPFLAQIYAFEAPVEAACAATPGVDPALLRTHLKIGALAADLEALGCPTPSAAVSLPRFETAAEALTWLWVLHRNTLLHGLIYRYLLGKVPVTVQVAGAYLSIVEGRAGALMRELGDALERVARSTSLVERMVVAANDAFRAQRQWYGCDYLSPERPPFPRRGASRRAA